MLHYGLEFEFFITGPKGEMVPAFKVTNNLDGNPVIGELRTKPNSSITSAVFELMALIHTEREAIEAKGYHMHINHFIKVDDAFIKSTRSHARFPLLKKIDPLEEFSIYGKSVGKVLPKGVYKASLQLNLSHNREMSASGYKRIAQGEYTPFTEKYWVSSAFNYVDIIRKLDKTFEKDIKSTKRVPGVFALKDGNMGTRVEYRSLPNTVAFMSLISILK